MKGQIIGYKRVSSIGQTTERQLNDWVLDEVFEDKVSGKDANRPALQAMLKHVRKGDMVVCHSMDRLGRNIDDLRKLVKDLTKRGVKIQFVKESLTFTGEDDPIANMMLSIMGAVAEFERALISERQKEGVQLAKLRGAYKGRKKDMTPERVTEIRQRVGAGETKTAIAKDLKISRETVYQYLK